MLGSWGVALAGQRSKLCCPALHTLLCQSTKEMSHLDRAGGQSRWQSCEGNQPGSLSPTLSGCVGRRNCWSMRSRQSFQVILCTPHPHSYCFQVTTSTLISWIALISLKCPLLNWHPLLLHLLTTQLILLSPKLYPEPRVPSPQCSQSIPPSVLLSCAFGPCTPLHLAPSTWRTWCKPRTYFYPCYAEAWMSSASSGDFSALQSPQ